MIMLNREKYIHSELIKGFITTIFWKGFSRILTVLTTLYCSNTLSQSEFGEYSFVNNTLSTIVVICAVHFSSLVVKFTAESKYSENSVKKLYLILIFTIILSVFLGLILLFSPTKFIESFVGENNNVVSYIRIIGLLLPVFILQPLISGIFRGIKEFNIVGKYELISSFLFMILVVIGNNYAGVSGCIISLLIYYFLFSIIGLFFVMFYRNKFSRFIRVDELMSQKKTVYKIIIPVFVMSFIDTPILWFAQAEIIRRDSFEVLAGLSVILQIRNIIQILPTYYFQAFVPIVSTLRITNVKEYFNKFKKTSNFQILFYLILFPFFVFFGKDILSLFGSSYVEYYNSFIISFFVLFLVLQSVLFKIHLTIYEHQRIIMLMLIISSICFIISFKFFINNSINIINSFLYSQGIQYLVQIIITSLIFLKDKKNVKVYSA